MALGMEFDAPTLGRTELTARKRSDYLRFHKNWLRFALKCGNLALIPTIVSAIQGRKLAQLLLDELDHSHLDPDTPAIVCTLKEIRQQLREKAREIQRLTVGVSDAYPLYNTLLEEYRRVRDQVARLDAYKHLTAPYQELSLEELCNSLAPNQILVLWIALPYLHGLLIVCPGAAPHWQETPDTKPLSDELARFCARLETHETCPHSSRQFWNWAAQALDELLWNPLRNALPLLGQRNHPVQLTLVTVGVSHLFPLTLSAQGLPLPPDQMNHFPGLLFYQQHCQRPDAGVAIPAWGLQYYEGDRGGLGQADTRIFMVQPEIEAIRAYWREVHSIEAIDPYDYYTGNQPVKRVHFSCHGGADPHYPWSTRLNIKQGVWLDSPHILRCATQPQEIIVAACVAMQTREDPDGDPFGIGAAFLLRNVGALVGATLPVSDLWMTLLSLLLHQSLGERGSSIGQGGRTLNQALVEAKRRLAAGDWFPDTAARLQRVMPHGLWRRWNEQALVHLDGVQYSWQKEEAFLRLPPRAERRQLVTRLRPLVLAQDTEQRAQAVRVLAQWVEQHRLFGLQEALTKTLLGRYSPEERERRYEGLAGTEVLADHGFDGDSRSALWHALHQAITARRAALITQGKSPLAAYRTAKDTCSAEWRGETLFRLSAEAIEAIVQQRIPPEPDLGILLHGVRVYGQGQVFPLPMRT